ncbi:MAG: PQQ-binding-like beta-propeller repeat protein [Planctomyces sp.]
MKLLLPLVFTLFFGDWPQFRGPKSDGHSAEVSTPLEWSETKNVMWKAEVAGLGWSSPVIVNGRIFLTTAVPQEKGLSLRALSLDSKTGTVIWDQEVRRLDEVPRIHAKNSHASPTPIVEDGAVYVHFGAQGMAALSAEDGHLIWTNVDLEYPPVHGNGGSPVLSDGRIFIVCDGSSAPFVAAIDAKTGKVAWKTARSVTGRINHSFVTAAVTRINGKTQVLAPGPDHMAVYDLESGQEISRVLAPGWSVVPQPAIGHGMVFYNHDYDKPELLAVKLGGQGDVTKSDIVWRIDRGSPSTPSPLLVGDELYLVSDKGIASCLDAKTGKRHWMERIGGNFSASPVFANGRVLLMDEDGAAIWVAHDKEWKELGRNQIPGRTFATPAFAEGAMFLRTDTAVYRIEAAAE